MTEHCFFADISPVIGDAVAIQIKDAPPIGWYFPHNPLHAPYFWTGRTRAMGSRVQGLAIAILKKPHGSHASPIWWAPDQVRRLGDATIFLLQAELPTTWREQEIAAAVEKAKILAASATV